MMKELQSGQGEEAQGAIHGDAGPNTSTQPSLTLTKLGEADTKVLADKGEAVPMYLPHFWH